MEIKKLDHRLTVCKVDSLQEVELSRDFYFIAKTDEEISLVCETAATPCHTTAREDGWRGFRIQGVLDFSLIGILSKIASLLAEHNISIFAVSTYNTDYVLVKEVHFDRAMTLLEAAGYIVI